MRQTTKAKHQLRLHELKKELSEFLELTNNLTLLQSVNEKAMEMTEAVDELQQLLGQGLAGNKLIQAISNSEAAILLDEIVDDDPVSELEGTMLSMAEGIENPEITRFLTEMMDKVERNYNQLLKKIHAYNALIKG